MTRVLAITGSYRDDGTIDQAVDAAVATVRAAGADVDVVQLRDHPIEFCLNCRECMQAPGEAPGRCVHDDRMHDLVARIEAADGIILASPTNFSSVTALFKRFMERLAVYGWWPWGRPAPVLRKRHPNKKAIVIASSAAPAFMGRLLYSTTRTLRRTARIVGARPVESVFIGLAAGRRQPGLSARDRRRIERAARKLVR